MIKNTNWKINCTIQKERWNINSIAKSKWLKYRAKNLKVEYYWSKKSSKSSNAVQNRHLGLFVASRDRFAITQTFADWWLWEQGHPTTVRIFWTAALSTTYCVNYYGWASSATIAVVQRTTTLECGITSELFSDESWFFLGAHDYQKRVRPRLLKIR